ncbi:MAG TPA: aryl-sulfate sulfotransferase [Bacteroidia bacterium]|nr:aryl-sulfate sulfotransferase [Bacteroidia bacterium]
MNLFINYTPHSSEIKKRFSHYPVLGKRIIALLSLLVQCIGGTSLPAQSFPDFTVSQWDTTSSGYYFLVPIRTGTGGPSQNPTHLILDSRGDVVYYKEFVSGNNTGDFKFQDNGLISYSYQNKFFLMDSTFTVIDSVRCKNGIVQDGHDMQVLPNGHFLLLGWENVVMDLSAYPWFNNNGSPGSSMAVVRSGVIQEQDANKNVVFEWHAANYFLFADVDTTRLNSPSNVDWTHFNAVEMDTDGNLLLSIRHFNEITKINRSTGDVMWRWGGKANQFTFTNDTPMFIGQHDCRRLANGNITILDNGAPGHPVAAKEYQLDETTMQATLIWSYCPDSGLYSGAIGNVHRSMSGNTLIDYGMVDQLATAFEVISPNGNTALEIRFSDTLRSYRAFNYTTLPWDLNRPVIRCTEINQHHFLDAGNGYSSYQWSTGETTQMIQVMDTGSYTVYVPKGDGGYISAEKFSVTDLADPCNTSSVLIGEIMFDEQVIFPNPFLDKINPKVTTHVAFYVLTNSMGQIIFRGTDIGQKDFSQLAPGLYLLHCSSGANNKFFKIIKQ